MQLSDGQELERDKPFAVVPVGIFSPWPHFSLIAGVGVEFAPDGNLGLTRVGVEYGCDLSRGWEAGVSVVWDAKWGNYDSGVLEFTFSKSFHKKRISSSGAP